MSPLRIPVLALCVALAACAGETGADAAVPLRDTRPAQEAPTAGPAAAAADSAATERSEPLPAVRDPAPDSAFAPLPTDGLQPQDDGARLLERAAARYAAIRSMRAAFAMETRNPLLRESVRSRGLLFQRRPDRILLRFEEPAGDVIVSDGRYIWVWYPSVDSTQVIRTPAAAGAGAVDLLAHFVGDPVERFRWTARGSEPVEGRAAAVLALDPRGQEAYRQLVLWIDREDYLVRRFEVTEHSGIVRRIDLRELVIDPELPDSLFGFVPPAGVRIVGG